MRLFQDAAGTIPAYEAGHPVGNVVRAGGTFDLTQSTALSRPTLARWPKGGLRNKQSPSYNAPQTWAPNGATVSVSGDAILFGRPMFLLRENTENNVHHISKSSTANPNLDPITFSVFVKDAGRGRVAWRATASGMPESSVLFDLSSGTAVQTTGGIETFIEQHGNGVYRLGMTMRQTQAGNAVVRFQLVNGTTFSYAGDGVSGVYVSDIQEELGARMTPYQNVTTANDATEPGVPDVWHLWNDGGDSLLGALPTGSHQVVTVSPLGKVDYQDVTGDGTAKNVLFGERVADILARSTPLTDAERLNVETFWQAQLGASYLVPPGMVPGGGRGMWQGLSLDESTAATPIGMMTVGAAAYGPELRGTFSDIKVGTPPEVPAYNASTGQGHVARSTSANVHGVRITSLDLSGPYVIDIENTGAQALNLRTGSATGSSLFSVQPGVRTRRVVPGGSASMVVAPAFDNVTTSFTLHSFRKLDSGAAQQDTALSRPMLTRWPRGGRRNILLNSEAFDAASWVVSNATISGGILSGVSGLAGSIRQQFLSAGGSYVASVRLRAGSTPTSVLGFRNEAAPAWLVTAGGILSGPGSYTVEDGTLRIRNLSAEAFTWVWFRVDAAPAGASISLRVYPESLSAGTGKSIEVSRAQVEAGTEVTAYQKVTYSGDVTETGVPDVWHLWNDGGDSLPAVLPTGAYEIAWVTHLGVIGYASVTSDGTTGIELLRAERMADVAVKRGRFTTYERARLTEQWSKYLP